MSKARSNPQKSLKRNHRPLFIVLSAFAVILSFFYSYRLRWLGDDIFIGLRYVQNFLDGHGLVYNVGEKVEGYTDFLWIMFISFFSWLKVDPLFTVQVLGILSSIGTVILFSIISYKLTSSRKSFVIPFVSLALALNYDYNVWATSGLETAFFGFLLSASFYVFFFSSFNERNKKIASGLFLCLALLTRPDTLLIFAVSNILLFWHLLKSRTKFQNLVVGILLFNLAFILIYIPYFIWRYHYYGFLFPNTYYDKLGYETMFSKGFYYLWLYFGAHFVSFLIVLLPPLVLIPFLNRKFGDASNPEMNRWNSAFLTAFIMVYAYLIGFVAKVGGDFMQARFVIPMAPFIYLIIFYCLLKIVKGKKINIIFAFLLILSFAESQIRFEFFKGYDKNGKKVAAMNGDVADERDVYVNFENIETEIKLGKAIHSAFTGIDLKLLIRGGQACFGYYANPLYCQEWHGLTDMAIAHSVVETRGRIGHEKQGSLDYFQKKGIHILIYRGFPTNDVFRRFMFSLPPFRIPAMIISYNADIMNKIKARYGTDIQFTDFPSYLDEYIQTKLPVQPRDSLKKDYENFKLFYFMHNNDKERENHFLNTLNNLPQK